MQVIFLKKLPKEFQKPRKEPNLLTYRDFQILVAEERKEVFGSVRVGINAGNPQEGLITDLSVVNVGMQGDALHGWYARLIKEAESVLKKKRVKKVDAYYLDGPGRLIHYYKAGYVPQRRTVEIEWNLEKVPNHKSQITNKRSLPLRGKYKIANYKKKDTKELEELLLDSHQPYWSPWSKTRLP